MESRRSSDLVPWLVISGLGVVLVLLVVKLAISTSDSEPESDRAAASELGPPESPQTTPEPPSEVVVSVTNPIPASGGAPPEKPEVARGSPLVEDNRPIIMRGFREGMGIEEAIEAERAYSGVTPYFVDDEYVRWEVEFLSKTWRVVGVQVNGRIEHYLMARAYSPSLESAAGKSLIPDYSAITDILLDKYGKPTSYSLLDDTDSSIAIWDIAEGRPWEISAIMRSPLKSYLDAWMIEINYYSQAGIDAERDRKEKERSSL